MSIRNTLLPALFIVAYLPAAAQVTDAGSGGTNFAHLPNTPLKGTDDTLVVHVKGSGTVPVVMITGHMHDETIYDRFIQRNSGAAKYHVAIPPGMGGTPAYEWPEEAEAFIPRPWSTRFEEELLAYMEDEIQGKVYLVASWYSGMGFALHIASRNPEKIAGLLLIGPSGRSPYYRQYRTDSGPDEPVFDVEAQRNTLGYIIAFWRTVDEYTWHNNKLPSEFYSNNMERGLTAVYQQSKQPVPINLRYFAEYMMDDLTDEVSEMAVPVHVVSTMAGLETLRRQHKGTENEGRSEEIYQMVKNSTKRDWGIGSNDHFTITFIEDTGLFVWDDRPEEFDRIFVGTILDR